MKNSYRPKLSRVLLASLVLSFALFAVSGTKIETVVTAQQTPSCPTCPPSIPRVIYTPLIEVEGASYTEINLNCRSSVPIDVVSTFYNADGTAIVGDTFQLMPSEIRFVDVRSLMPEAYRNQHNWGGMTLSYSGAPMTVWAQLTFHEVDQGDSFNAFFTVLEAASSATRSAVWKAPEHSDATIALGNYSNTPATSTLTFSNGDTETVTIPAFGTAKVTRRNNGNRRTPIGAESVTLNSTGESGKVIPMGFVSHQSFVSSIRFADTVNVSQPNIYSTNLRLKNTVPNIVLRNTTNSQITATPKFFPVGENAGNPVELAPLTIPANGVKQVNLAPLVATAANRPDLDSVSVQILSSGASGSLIGATNFKNTETGVEYDIPLRDSGQARNSSGAIPVRLDDDYSTILAITNVGDQPGRFLMQVNYGNGSVYAMYPRELSPGQTAVFDFRKIRNQQTPDSTGRLLPQDFANGQIKWSMVGQPTTRFVARGEVISANGNVSSSYSCPICCNISYHSSTISPQIGIVQVGDSFNFQAMQTDIDCGQFLYSPYPVAPIWSSGDNGIATPGQNGMAIGIAPGTTTYSASWDGVTWIADINETCDPWIVPVVQQAEVFVPPSIEKIQYKGPNNQTYADAASTLYVMKGTSVSFLALPDPANVEFPTGFPVWSGSSGASGTGEMISVLFNTISTSKTDFKTVSASSGNTVTINVIVYELTGVLTPNVNFAGRSLTDFGLKEDVSLDFSANPAVRVTNIGGLRWTLQTGTGQLNSLDDGTGTFTAAGVAESPTLRIEVLAGPSKGLYIEKNISVVAPTNGYMVKTSLIARNTGAFGGAFRGEFYLEPKNVSFAKLEFSEGSVNAIASGYLASLNGISHAATIGVAPIGNCNSITGCKVIGQDTYSSHIDPPFAPHPQTGYVGSFLWAIPWRYHTGQLIITFTTANHICNSNSIGTATLEKKGAGPYQVAISDPGSGF